MQLSLFLFLYIYISLTHTTVRIELLQEVFQKQESFLKFLNMELAEWFQQKFCLSLSNTHTREREKEQADIQSSF